MFKNFGATLRGDSVIQISEGKKNTTFPYDQIDNGIKGALGNFSVCYLKNKRPNESLCSWTSVASAADRERWSDE